MNIKEGARLQLYYCGSCGAVFTQNYRDRSCPNCDVCMKWRLLQFELGAPWIAIDGGEAPHEED